MSSAFTGLFKQRGETTNSLFSPSSKFKRDGDDAVVAPQPPTTKPVAKKTNAVADKKSKKKATAKAPAEAAPAAKDTTKRKRKAEEQPAAVSDDKPSTKKTTRKKTSEPASAAAATTKTKPTTTKPKKDTSSKNPSKNPAPAPASDTEDDAEQDEANISLEEQRERLTRTIFVGNLPANATPKSIKKLFSQFGTVESVRLRSIALKETEKKLPRKAAVASGNTDTTRAPPHAYVVFSTIKKAQKALKLNMTVYENRHLVVNSAAPPTKALQEDSQKKGPSSFTTTGNQGGHMGVVYEPSRSLFIGNVHLETQDEELIQFFLRKLGSEFGEKKENPLQAVRLVRDPDSHLGKGIAYVMFTSTAARKAALGLDGQQLRGRDLRITNISGGGGVRGKKVASWQDTKAKKPKFESNPRARGGGSTPSNHRMSTGSGSKYSGGGSKKKTKGGGGVEKVVGKRKKDGKRPAVMARKMAQKAKSQKRK